MDIKSNDVILCRSWLTDVFVETATCLVVAQLAVADSVRVVGDSERPAIVNAPEAGFAGHIIADNLSP